MNQYIITEENLQEVFEHADWGMTNFQKFKDKLRPYNPQAEREMVLENIDKIIDNEINYICENDDGIWSKCDVVDRIQKIWVKISEELREGKGDS